METADFSDQMPNTGPETTADSAMRDRLAEAVLGHASFDGWTEAAIAAAAADLEIGEGEARRLFPGGPIDVIDWVDRRATERMEAALAGRDLSAMKLREKVTQAVRLRLEPLNAHREALRRAASMMALPFNAGRTAQALYRTVDAVWHALGDTSTDFNFYTKRATLAAVYSATVLVWLNDRSPDCATTWAFLDRRIADVMQVEKLKAGLRSLFRRADRSAMRRV